MDKVVTVWYERAQINYAVHYMALYAAFNAWYRGYTGKTNDREALNLLRADEKVWLCYCDGEALHRLSSVMINLAECTQREPLPTVTPHWKGEVAHKRDWPSLLEYWYRVRCMVMHGEEIAQKYVFLAYETLNIFMGAVLARETASNTVYNTYRNLYN